jgi:hypothetical protein
MAANEEATARQVKNWEDPKTDEQKFCCLTVAL